MLLKIELNNRAQCKNAIKFPFSVTVSKFSPYTLPHFPLTDVVVGFERTIYTVPESAGSIEVCAVVTNPPMDQPLSSSFTLLADTLPASAGKPSTVS